MAAIVFMDIIRSGPGADSIMATLKDMTHVADTGPTGHTEVYWDRDGNDSDAARRGIERVLPPDWHEHIRFQGGRYIPSRGSDAFCAQYALWDIPVPAEVGRIEAERPRPNGLCSGADYRAGLSELAEQGWAEEDGSGRWDLTGAGRQRKAWVPLGEQR